jgi:hypothetical protein
MITTTRRKFNVQNKGQRTNRKKERITTTRRKFNVQNKGQRHLPIPTATQTFFLRLDRDGQLPATRFERIMNRQFF